MRSFAVSRAVKSFDVAYKPLLFRHQSPLRSFHATPQRYVVRPFLLADIGEGIREVQIIQWFVKPGARVEQFDPLCEVQSDKASVEITSRFDGVIKKLHYEADDTAFVGKPLVDIDIQSEIKPEDEAVTAPPEGSEQSSASGSDLPLRNDSEMKKQGSAGVGERSDVNSQHAPRSKHATLSTPAVRHLSKELDVDIVNIQGTGKDGRVLKEDVQKYAASRNQTPSASSSSALLQPKPGPVGEDRTVSLSQIQSGMFKSMTRSLSIPHFLYTTAVDMSALNNIRQILNSRSTHSPSEAVKAKITPLPFILKAVSLAFQEYPLLNSSLDTSDPAKPQITYGASHDFGIAVDTPSGLMVPIIRGLQNHTIQGLAAEISRISALARAERLSPGDLKGATFSVSNVGSIGGGVVAPVIVAPQVAILGIGRARVVPAFDGNGNVVRKEEAVFSWSADHRVVDGAMAARCAEKVRAYLEDPGTMMADMR
ncbi:hypothetical protein EV356DRAFT_494229 [Viridothelium virens]|uniref:Dihydrolipoamide acetyltransferase component of pyruvate dehydrogenase complex n=1 Tax=Viridothelium virens TaxID=1048519 RepID=A0A6A6GV88_VIRVR|nr:hypothetical protein EV356DRAFT_494229 [Viridothelium virens]